MEILVIDDESDIGKLITTTAQNMGFSCTATTTVDMFRAAIHPNITIMMIDLMIPDIDGVELLRTLGQQECKSKIILMSGVDKRVLQVAYDLAEYLGLSIVGVLQKPFRIAELRKILSAHATIAPPHNTHLHSSTRAGRRPIITIFKEEIEMGIDRKGFILYYQPQIEITTGKMLGMEALVRWQHPTHGLIFPDVFISQIEKIGLIDQLGWYVAEMALNEIKQFINNDGFMPTISMNVSPYSLSDLKFPDKFLALAKATNLEPKKIILEITESGLFKELTRALDILTRLRMKEFNISIDDFGTGFAMMQQLRNVPATELKIDKSLVQDIPQDNVCIMIKKIIEMGHELGMNIIAEGVETAQQLEFLRINKCDRAQGYFFSKPKPIVELLVWANKG